jgi:hypothetical protein
MAAGLGFKDFTTGEVLTAADVDGYLMQGIWVFASAAARDSAVTSPQEGNFAYLKDTNTTTYYTGSAWTNLDTTGMVNPMTTTGDTIYSSSGSTPARLGIGTAGQVLTVNSGATAPEWKTPASSGALTLIYSNTFSAGTTVSFDNVFTSTYRDYRIVLTGTTSSATDANMFIRLRASSSDAATNYKTIRTLNNGSTVSGDTDPVGTTYYYTMSISNASPTLASAFCDVFQPQASIATKFKSQFLSVGSTGGFNSNMSQGYHSTASSYDGFSLIADSGTVTGTVRVYGYQNS